MNWTQKSTSRTTSQYVVLGAVSGLVGCIAAGLGVGAAHLIDPGSGWASRTVALLVATTVAIALGVRIGGHDDGRAPGHGDD